MSRFLLAFSFVAALTSSAAAQRFAQPPPSLPVSADITAPITRLQPPSRAELRAIQALETDVTNGSLEQSMTAVLDKISGGVLVGARQRQNRAQVLAAVVEQLAVEGKRARDTEAATLNMQLTSWRDREAVNAAFVAGAGDALGTWRQP